MASITMGNLFIYEILEKAAAPGQSPEAQAQVLRSHSSEALKTVLRCIYDTKIKWMKRVPLYKPDDSPIGLSLSHLLIDYKRLYLFSEAQTQKLGLNKQRQLLAMMLETLPEQEAKILESIVQEKYYYPGLSAEVVLQAFPGLFDETIAVSPQ